MSKIKRLSNLDALEVSFVPKGANKRKILLTKEEGEQMDEILKELLNFDLKDEAAVDKKIEELLPAEIKKDEKQVAIVKANMKAAVKLLAGLAKRLPEGDRDKVMASLHKLAGVGKVTKTEGDGKPDPKEPKAPEPKEPKAGDPEKVAKEDGMDPEVKKQIEAVLKSNEALGTENKGLKEEIKKERDLRVEREFTDRAKAYEQTGDVKVIAKLMKDTHENQGDEALKSLETILKASSAKIEAGNIFSELGSSSSLGTDLDSQVSVKKEAVMKADPKLTAEAAEAKVFEDNPELYNQYLDENPAQGGR